MAKVDMSVGRTVADQGRPARAVRRRRKNISATTTQPPLTHLNPVQNISKPITFRTQIMEYFTANDGQKLAYQDIGDKSLPPLILVS